MQERIPGVLHLECMAPIRIITAGLALLLTAASSLAFATDMVSISSAATENVGVAGSSASPRKVRIIDLSAANTVTSDETKWYNRAPKPPVQKNTATAKVEARAEKPKKKRVVQRAAPRQDSYSAYASESTRERQGFGFFNWN